MGTPPSSPSPSMSASVPSYGAMSQCNQVLASSNPNQSVNQNYSVATSYSATPRYQAPAQFMPKQQSAPMVTAMVTADQMVVMMDRWIHNLTREKAYFEQFI